jgi:hypothetical protein
MELPALADYLGQKVAGHQDCASLAGQAAEQLPQAPHALAVEPVGRFVADQDLGVAGQGCGEGEPLAHPEGEAAHPPVPDLGELERGPN